MGRRQPSPPQTLFQGNEFLRLMTMIVMLGVLWLLITRSSDSKTWTWLAADVPASSRQNSPPPAENGPSDNNPSLLPGAGKPAETKLVFNGPTDQDPEEWDAIQEEFQAVSDGTTKIQSDEEMPSYRRVLRWVQSQTPAEMLKRAKSEAVFNQFYQQPDKYRGQLFKLELTVRLIRKSASKINDTDLYEVWGTTAESKVWLYDCVVIDLPKGMPIGREISEKVTFIGYFFKLQGYQPADAKPNAAPLQAPMFIGRLIWHPAEKPQAERSDWYWGLFLLIGFLAFIIIRWGLLVWKPRRGSLTSSSTVITKRGGRSLEEWLAHTESNDFQEGSAFEEDADPQHGPPDGGT